VKWIVTLNDYEEFYGPFPDRDSAEQFRTEADHLYAGTFRTRALSDPEDIHP